MGNKTCIMCENLYSIRECKKDYDIGCRCHDEVRYYNEVEDLINKYNIYAAEKCRHFSLRPIGRNLKLKSHNGFKFKI